ncbi:MAG TPA: hypothetical protein DCM38_10320 [Gammaproteobacteria bacterium]|nr:hypothetical protein [Gammaproteobacteria bacterium]
MTYIHHTLHSRLVFKKKSNYIGLSKDKLFKSKSYSFGYANLKGTILFKSKSYSFGYANLKGTIFPWLLVIKIFLSQMKEQL